MIRILTTDVKIDRINIGDDYEGLFPELNKETINYIHSKLFNPDYDQDKPEGVMEQIIYRSDLVLEAREFLKTTTYKGFWILKDGIINPKIYEALQDKFNKGEELSKLERIIADVASFYMGGPRSTRDLATMSELPKVRKGDTHSALSIQTTEYKRDQIKQLIYSQLQHYSKTGERLYNYKDGMARTGWSDRSVRGHVLSLMKEIFKDPKTATLVRDMVFGRITTSYHKTKKEYLDLGLILLTTPTQFFEMLKSRGDKTPSSLKVEVKCTRNEKHLTLAEVGHKRGCSICGHLSKAINIQDILDTAKDRKLQPVSFRDDTQQLTEAEFDKLKETWKEKYQDTDDYRSSGYQWIVLRWRCLECDHIFEKNYDRVRHVDVKHYCPKCVPWIGQQQTIEAATELFQDYIVQSFRSGQQLTKFLPDRILLMDKYRALRDPRVHVDGFGIIRINDKVFKIAIEHHGAQHYSFESYLYLRRKAEAIGIYKTTEYYREQYEAYLERDRVKEELFKDLNEAGYYLIVVPHWISLSTRSDYIKDEFIRQTDVNPGQASIVDYL